MKKKVIIGIGSNKGNKMKNIKMGIKYLQEFINIEKISSFIETPPMEGVKGGVFLNGVIAGTTQFTPYELLEILKNTEKKIGRKFPHKKGDEREIDFDIIFYSNEVVNTKKLKIPHPRYRKRYFVMEPLVEIEPEFVDPELNKKVIEIYKEFKNGNSGKNFLFEGKNKKSKKRK